MKIGLILAIAASGAMLASCGSAAERSAESEAAVTTAESLATATFTIPSRETFAEVPQEAESSFDCVIDAVGKHYPNEEKGSKRLYGYLGTENVNGCSCYAFAVYDVKKDVPTQVAKAAITADNTAVYVYSDDDNSYELLEITKEETELEEYHWTVTEANEN